MTHADIIEALGGAGPVAAELGCHHSSVRLWRKAGIPAARWAALVDLARKQGRVVTFEALAEGANDRTPPPPLRRGPKPRQVSA